jgi:hypothetical protein
MLETRDRWRSMSPTSATVFEGAVRRALGDKQGSRHGHAIVLDIGGQRFADVGRDRHTIVSLPLAPHEKLTRPPVDVIELDSDHLRRAQSEPSH